jgi:hypothetical protein
MRRLLIGFAVAGLWVCSATAGTKSYTVNLTEKSTLGGVQLKPGEYRMMLENSVAVLSDGRSRQVVKVPVTVTNVAKKYELGEILSSKTPDNSNKIDAIEIRGTKLKVEFKN